MPTGQAFFASRKAATIVSVPLVRAPMLSAEQLLATKLRLLEACPFARPAADAQAAIAARRQQLLEAARPHPKSDDAIENEPWREPFDYPDPPPPHGKPNLRVVKKDR